jgi:hypothetical protein
MSQPLVSVVTGSIGRPSLTKCIESVANQTYKNIQHLVFCDGPDHASNFHGIVNRLIDSNSIKFEHRLDIIDLPYAIGNNRWNAHRQLGAGTYIADGDYVIYLDDDNTLDPDHIQQCMDVIQAGAQWSYTLRKIVNVNGDFLCNDDCESLGKWPSVLDPQDFFIDVNCYCLPKLLAIQITPIWYRKFREPGQPEVDRVLCHALRQIAPNFECTYKYSVNYAVASNSDLSVKPDFFQYGNDEMEKRYQGMLPWKK